MSIEIKTSLLSFLLIPSYFLICYYLVAVMDCYLSIRDPVTTEDFHLAPSSIGLARFALDILVIPPILDQCERLFSSVKILLKDYRFRL